MSSPEFEGIDDFRKGDEAPDARIGDFNVYGGAPIDRSQLQAGDPEMLATLDEELSALLAQHQRETGSDLP